MKPSRCEFLTLLGVTAITGNPPWHPRFVGAKAWSLDLTRNIPSGARRRTGSYLFDGLNMCQWKSQKLLHSNDIVFGLERRDGHAL